MLRIHILDVGQGDSIILEHHHNDGTRSFAVIDSNRRPDQHEPAALTFLKREQVTELSFVALTHPHMDHYTGLLDVLKAYQGNIGNFLIFPVGQHIETTLKKVARTYLRQITRVEDSPVRRGMEEFVKVVEFLKSDLGLENVYVCDGFWNDQAVAGFAGVRLIALLPPKKVLGWYLTELDSDSETNAEALAVNDLSIGLLIQYAGTEVVLGGDVPRNNWYNHRHNRRYDDALINAQAVKLPHHGSKYDFDSTILNYLYTDAEVQKFAIISANGSYHPDEATIDLLVRESVDPYCTNLMGRCGSRVEQLITDNSVDSEVLKHINQRSTKKPVPCQGTVTIQIDDHGTLKVQSEHEALCPYRVQLPGFDL